DEVSRVVIDASSLLILLLTVISWLDRGSAKCWRTRMCDKQTSWPLDENGPMAWSRGHHASGITSVPARLLDVNEGTGCWDQRAATVGQRSAEAGWATLICPLAGRSEIRNSQQGRRPHQIGPEQAACISPVPAPCPQRGQAPGASG